MSEVKVGVMRVGGGKSLDLPRYETEGAVCVDLRAAEEVLLLPGERALVSTGICVSIPKGYEAQIRPRSGLALKYGVSLANSPGTIDSDYRGEVKVILINFGGDPFSVNIGDRIAQMLVSPVVRIKWEEMDELDSTERGAGGFGSTGGAQNAN